MELDTSLGSFTSRTQPSAALHWSMDDALKAGARLFNARHYWEAHEAWEEPWHTAQGDHRKLLSALILLAAAMHKRWIHGSLTHRNFHKAEIYLDQLPAQFEGIHLQDLRKQVWEALRDSEVTPEIPLD